MAFVSTNPATGEQIRTYAAHTDLEVEAGIAATARAQETWARCSMEDRAALFRKLAEKLRGRSESFAELMALEMGKPLDQGRSEVEKCAWVCDYYADNGAEFLADEPVSTEASASFVAYRPLGVVLAVMPWNFPFWQVFRFAVPTLMAGNGALLKHASNVCGCAVAIEGVFIEAGFPADLFRTLLITSDRVAAVIQHELVAAVTLTGSTPAGRAVAGVAAGSLKKSVLELGGSDPYVILEDADLSQAAEICAQSRLINSGQSCIAAKRFVVQDVVRREFEDRLVAAMARRSVGDPFDGVDVGPQAREDLRDDVHRQVLECLRGGARLLVGGELPPGPGAFYPVTVLTDVGPGTPGYDEEIFGPVASIVPAATEEEAIRKANESPFGLGAAVFTRDVERGRRIARERLNAGACFVNALVRSDPRMPFGGVKQSGYGRELGRHGIREFVNVKTVWIA